MRHDKQIEVARPTPESTRTDRPRLKLRTRPKLKLRNRSQPETAGQSYFERPFWEQYRELQAEARAERQRAQRQRLMPNRRFGDDEPDTDRDVIDVPAVEVGDTECREVALRPLSPAERRSLVETVSKIPATRDTLPVTYDFATGVSFRGGGRGSMLALCFFFEALARVGTSTSFVHGLTFEGTVRDFAKVLDEASSDRREGRGYYSTHFGEIIQAIENLDQLRIYLITKEADGTERLRRLPVVAEVDTAVDITPDGRIRVEFNPGLLRKLQFNPKLARTLLNVRDMHRVRTPRAATMIALLSAHRHLAARYNKPLVIPIERVRKLFNLESERRGFATRRASRKTSVPTKYATWSKAWEVLKSVADKVKQGTDWRFDMDTVREGRHVVAVRWTVTKVDLDYRKNKHLTPRSRAKVR